MSTFTFFSGALALSEFRCAVLGEKICTQIQANRDGFTSVKTVEVPALLSIHACYLHVIESEGTLTDQDTDHLERLLEYGSKQLVKPLSDYALFVSPRSGTISPWSSKASDIAHNCGLQHVHRIERAVVYSFEFASPIDSTLKLELNTVIEPLIHDRMTEQVFAEQVSLQQLFIQHEPRKLIEIDMLGGGRDTLVQADQSLGLALSDNEIDYLFSSFKQLKRNPSNVELMMFAQANSEHCRHKIFNASWSIDGNIKPHSLFGMIKNTYAASNGGKVLSAYSDNSAVIEGRDGERLIPQNHADKTTVYSYSDEPIHYLLKVETHNHPTAIAPYPGAATGAGGEIRDEGATGAGAKPKAGLTGFSVSNLNIPNFKQAWEFDYGRPERIVSALDIMLEAPIGGAAFNNEFGRPNLGGYFRTYEQKIAGLNGDVNEEQVRGYHKPIMIAGGIGNIRQQHVQKQPIKEQASLIVLGGPAMLIGLGGSAASSMSSGQSSADLDFASVQRDNPEMERRCQEVIDRCWQLGDDNPIAFIHDVGAGGLSNALPELVKDGGVGGVFSLRDIPCDERGMAPLEIWCNESQERYVLAVATENLKIFDALCKRERAPYAVVGHATKSKYLKLVDSHFSNAPVDLPMDIVFGNTPKMHRNVTSVTPKLKTFDTADIDFDQALHRVLRLPTVASKSFLITIGDRTVSGLVSRDQMVGPWQVPVSDAAITCNSYTGYGGEAMAMGERTPIALIDAAASARMAVGEAITNIAGVGIDLLSDIVLSANWMAAAGVAGEDAKLYEAVEAIGIELCPELGIVIPVGKDSLSMNTQWQDAKSGETKQVIAPLSLIITAAVSVPDIRCSVTPQLQSLEAETVLVLVDIANGTQRLGASALAQVYSELGDEVADLDNPAMLSGFFKVIQALLTDNKILAYHDRSDGGLIVSALEMAFAGRVGLDINLPEGRVPEGGNDRKNTPITAAFNEELGALIQIKSNDLNKVLDAFKVEAVAASVIATTNKTCQVNVRSQNTLLGEYSLASLHGVWHESSYQIQALRDNPICAEQEFLAIKSASDSGLFAKLNYDLNGDVAAPYIAKGTRPKIAILREQGVNSQYEMAAAFDRAGFETHDIHMSDLLAGRALLSDYKGLAACGGFSYGDVLGAGEGWAKTILFNAQLNDQFTEFFTRNDSFTLGVCNGCQMLSTLRELIPGTEHWPQFVRNQSEQFEARLVMVEVKPSNSPLLSGMAGSQMPIVVSHGEGRAEFSEQQLVTLQTSNQSIDAISSLQYVDHQGQLAQQYPHNPNGSPYGLAGVCSEDGRVTIMMPHPERVFRTVQNSWAPSQWAENGAWMRLFQNARVFAG